MTKEDVQRLYWIGDHIDKGAGFRGPDCITIPMVGKHLLFGRANSKTKLDYVLQSSHNPRMVSRKHAELRNTPEGLMLYDYSLNGTYVNYKRLSGGTYLNHGDVICFGHANGAKIKPGQKVPEFDHDLKYRYAGGPDPKSSSKASKPPTKNKARPSPPSSVSDLSDDSAIENNVTVRGDDSRLGSSSKKSSLSAKESSATKKRKSQPMKKGAELADSKRRRTTAGLETESGPTTTSVNVEVEVCDLKAKCRRPTDSRVDWIQCDKCEKWYHQTCVGIKDEADVPDTYYCPPCKKKLL